MKQPIKSIDAVDKSLVSGTVSVGGLAPTQVVAPDYSADLGVWRPKIADGLQTMNNDFEAMTSGAVAKKMVSASVSRDVFKVVSAQVEMGRLTTAFSYRYAYANALAKASTTSIKQLMKT
jgi:hypothetical protein